MENLPISKQDLIKDFQLIGIKKSMNLMVHSSLSKIGWVIGGANTVVEALLEIIEKKGTLAMPAATPLCLHPEDWDITIKKNWISKIVKYLPVFNLETTPTTMGIIPETFRKWPNTLRSNHPISSVCANGKLAKRLSENHNLEMSEGTNTPYEEIYKNDFKVLLLGVGFNRCTMLHFAESKSKNRRITTSRYPIIRDNNREWIEVKDMENDNSTHFPTIGEMYMNKSRLAYKKIGQANSVLMDIKSLVDFGTAYFDNNILK